MMKAPFPYFGSKKKITKDVWDRFGTVENYIEPFAGSLAVLLANPVIPKIETVNDLDCFIPNFWRAIAGNVDKVIEHADYPVIEADLHARHKFLLSPSADDFKVKINSDPSFYDAKIAGWWVWGMNVSIGMTFGKSYGFNTKPFLSHHGQNFTSPGADIKKWLTELQKRMKKVRVCNGDWSRVVTPPVTYKNKSLTKKNGIVGVFLDPPYPFEDREKDLYRVETDVFQDVCKWAVDNGNNPIMRIAVCGLDGGYEFPSDWEVFHWKTRGGYSSLSKKENRGKENSKKETIWFSPHCLKI
jgi:site-specific DNA-adenine methylase